MLIAYFRISGKGLNCPGKLNFNKGSISASHFSPLLHSDMQSSLYPAAVVVESYYYDSLIENVFIQAFRIVLHPVCHRAAYETPNAQNCAHPFETARRPHD